MAVIGEDSVDNDVKGLKFDDICSEVSFDYLPEAKKEGLLTNRKHVIVEKCLKTYFDKDIPLRKNWSILKVNHDVDIITESGGVKEVDEVMLQSSLSILFTISSQRGSYSGYPYQVSINHRVMSLHHIMAGDDNGDLFDSATQNSTINSFGEGDLTGLTFFGVETAPAFMSESNPANEIENFVTPARMNAKLDGQQRVDYAVLEGLRAVRISAFHFKKACRFFNKVFGKKDSDGNVTEYPDDHPLSMADTHGLARLLKGHSLLDSSGWRRFLKEFQLEHMFPYDEQIHALVQIRRLGEYFRALVPINPGVSRGQHRCHALAFIGCDYLDIYRSVPLPRFNGSKLRRSL